jgi:hypothetical protein
MSDAPGASLAAAVSQLYGLAPGAFIEQRNALAAQAKSAGDKELAARIRQLPKPALGVWLLNQLARHRPDELARVLGLSASLRQAQEQRDGDELRRLSKVRAEVMRDVLAAGRSLGPELGQPVSDSVAAEAEQALRAALADEAAAAALVSGQLVKGLASTGFGGVDLAEALAAPELSAGDVLPAAIEPSWDRLGSAGAGAGAARPVARRPEPGLRSVGELPGRREAEQREAAEREAELRAADAQAEGAAAAAREADQALADARHEADETADRMEEIAAELSRLRDQVRDLERAARDARKAAREADRARRRLGTV